MFSKLLKKKNVEVKKKVEEPKINIEEEIEKIELQINEEGLKEYIEAAEKVNFNPSELIREKLLIQFVKEKIKVYKYDKVVEFMNNEYGKTFRPTLSGWIWLKLSKKEHGDYNSTNWYSGEPSGRLSTGIYQQAIPIDILRKVGRVKERNPDVSIFVTEIGLNVIEEPADPFVMATHQSWRKGIVFGHWNEPNFKD